MGDNAYEKVAGRQFLASENDLNNERIFLQLKQLFQGELDQVEKLIQQDVGSEISLIPELSDYLIRAGGKRLRPLVTLACAAMGPRKPSGHISLAAAVEFIHSATLLHDDVVDESELRRGRKTANSVWGNSASVLVGDFLFAKSFERMIDSGSLEILNILAKASAVIAEGEVLQLAHVQDINLTGEIYYRIIDAKTATLFGAAAQVGALSAGVSTEDSKSFFEFGRQMGLSFQLSDDALDYFGDEQKLGKSIGDDFYEGKLTMPLVLAFEGADADDRARLEQLLNAPVRSKSEFEEVVSKLRKINCYDRIKQLASEHAVKASESLTPYSNSTIWSLLEKLVFATVNRQS